MCCAIVPTDVARPQAAFPGWALFGEPMDLYAWAGAVVIAVSSVYMAYREAKAREDRARGRLIRLLVSTLALAKPTGGLPETPVTLSSRPFSRGIPQMGR